LLCSERTQQSTGWHEEQAAADSETGAFDDVFHAHYERIARVIVRVVRDPARAEDLTVEVFWKFWRNPQAHGEKAGGWLYRAAVRMALDELRRQARRIRHERSQEQRQVLNPEEVHAAAEERERVRLVLAAMKRDQAEMLPLRNHGLSYEELASTLALNPASVGTLVSRAQQAFRKEYVKHYGEPNE